MWKPPIGDLPDVDALYSGIPEWLGRSVRDWMRQLFSYSAIFYSEEIQLASEFDRVTRNRQPLTASVNDVGLTSAVFARGDDFTLNFVDFLLHKIGKRPNWVDWVVPLSVALDQAGSEWSARETEQGGRLLKRVDDTVQSHASQVVAESGLAGRLLAEAWHAMYGRAPDHEEAYEKSIKAVEEASAPLVSPKNSRATLGTIIRDMKQQGDWGVPIADPPGDANRTTVVSMVESLWFGQESRHGGNGYRKPTPEEAEAAVTLAVALVHAFTRGLVARRSE